MFPILQIGPLAIQLPGLLILLGVWFGIVAIEREADRLRLDRNGLSNLVFYSLIAGVLGARLGYALRYLEIYLRDPGGLFALNANTMAPIDGVLVGVLVVIVYAQRREFQLWPTLDALTPGLSVFVIGLACAHISSGDAFGSVTSLPWGIELWGAVRHPTQMVELIAALALFAALWRWRRRAPFPGYNTLTWLALYAVTRLILEGLRGDSILIIGGIRSTQVISLGVALAALVSLRWLAVRAARVAPGTAGSPHAPRP
jgi:prolipoprotein diacylglyceryl transferase